LLSALRRQDEADWENPDCHEDVIFEWWYHGGFIFYFLKQYLLVISFGMMSGRSQKENKSGNLSMATREEETNSERSKAMVGWLVGWLVENCRVCSCRRSNDHRLLFCDEDDALFFGISHPAIMMQRNDGGMGRNDVVAKLSGIAMTAVCSMVEKYFSRYF